MHFKFQAFQFIICAQLVLSFTTLTRDWLTVVMASSMKLLQQNCLIESQILLSQHWTRERIYTCGVSMNHHYMVRYFKIWACNMTSNLAVEAFEASLIPLWALFAMEYALGCSRDWSSYALKDNRSLGDGAPPALTNPSHHQINYEV